jgi:threonine/homoserine/homoserine lactone efflux protein
MFLSTWLIYVAVALAAIFCPGPAVFLAISNSVTFGWRRVGFSSLGNMLGLLVISSLAMAGLGALLKADLAVFTGVKLVGAGYLIWLGLRQWRAQASVFNRGEAAAGPGGERSNRQIFFQGLLIALTNPKAILFFTALFPQFIRSDRALAPQFLILTSTFMGLSFLTLMLYGFVANAARAWFADGNRSAWFNRCTGSIFLVLGIGVLRLRAGRA